jgi:hypothetical protein
VGNSPEVVARTTARNLLDSFKKYLYTNNAPGSAQAIRGIFTKANLNALRILIDRPSGIVFKSEAEFIKFLLTLCPEQDREQYVESLYVLRRANAIILRTLERGGDFSDPLVIKLRESINQIKVE